MNTLEDYCDKRKIGEYFGYPKCCIDNFIENIMKCDNIKKRNIRKICVKAAGDDGFMPCIKHSEQILNNEINIKDVICDRKCEKPFPDDNGIDIIKFRNIHLEKIKPSIIYNARFM